MDIPQHLTAIPQGVVIDQPLRQPGPAPLRPAGQPGRAEETRYTPAAGPVPPATYGFKAGSIQLRRPHPGEALPQGQQHTQANRQFLLARESEPNTLEHREPGAIKTFRDIAANGETRAEKYRQVNLFV